MSRESETPEFLRRYAPTRGRRRLTPFSRVPPTGKIAEVLDAAADRNPDQRITLDRAPDIDPTGPVSGTYAEWARYVEEVAAWLHAAGVRPWDRVAVLKANHFDVALLGAAAARLGAVPALLAWTHPPEFAQPMLRRLERPFLIADQERLKLAGMDAAAVAALTTRTIVVDGAGDRTDLVGLADLKGGGPAPFRPRAATEPMVITHTSGTTGVPKLVMHSAESAYALSLVEAERWPLFGLRRSDVLAYCDPFCHQRTTTGMITMATVAPRMTMLSDPDSPKVAELLAADPPTVVETLPNIYLHWEPLARDPRRLFGNVRLFVNSFDAIHTRTIRTFLDATDRRLPVWWQSWSQSEAGAMVIRPYTRASVRERGVRPPVTQVLGWPIPGLCEARAVDPETGEPVPAGQVGVVEINQPGRCLAYVGEQDRHEAKCRDWWWNTGDLGTVSKRGAIRLVDREIDRIPGGSAIELEDVLLDRLPQATEIVVLPRGDDLPVPLVSTHDDQPLDELAWSRAVSDLPPLADPVRVDWADWERTATWKIRRVAMRERLLGGARAIGTGRWT
ncbi:class I adenylate-forming enzyme family protein [Actinophytocola sediminis]